MKACLFDGVGVRVDADVPDPVPAAGETLVQVRLAGVCQTDLEIVKGYMGYTGVLGHEFVGTAVGGRYAGQRVVGGINCVCHDCDMCQAGLPAHCRRRTTLGIAGRDGAMAERLVLPDENLVPVPDAVTDEQAVFAEPLAAAIQVTHQVKMKRGQRIVVLGDGRLGQLVAQVLQARGLEPIVVGRMMKKLNMLGRLGIINVQADLMPPSKDADVVVECTGTAAGLGQAMAHVRPRGTIVLKSTVADTAGLNLAPLVVDEITVVGSRCGPMDEAVAMLAAGKVRVEPMITAEFPLGDAAQALVAAADPAAIKILIRI